MTATLASSRPPGSGATPLRTSRLRTVLLVAAAAVLVVVVAVVVFAVTRTPDRPVDYLSATSGSPDGARAVIEVLRDQGVQVDAVDTLAELERLGLDPAETTIAMYDFGLVLGEGQHQRVMDAAHRVVVFDAWPTETADFAPGVELSEDGYVGGLLPADCDVAAVQRAEEISTTGYAYDVTEAERHLTGCYEADGGVYGLVQTRTHGTEVVLVGVSGAITNGQVLDAGNAAFALNLLGADPHLVWYTPSLAELQAGGAANPTALNPPWVTPLILLLAGVVLAAAVWRGRRLGPLVAERLPVIVRANETMTGRARLYERASSRTHALDALRIGTIERLATACGLPRRATVDEVADAVAALLGRDRAAIRALLVETQPSNDAALVRLSDELLILEADVTRIARGR